jgi:hypothetical protein
MWEASSHGDAHRRADAPLPYRPRGRKVRRLEVERDQSTKAKQKKVTRRKISRPWTRPGKNALCQEVDLLMLVQEYDYELSDSDFRRYAKARGILHVAGEPGSRRWEFYSDYSKTKDEFLGDSYFQLGQMVDRKQYAYTLEEMEIAWRIVLLGRSALQDCWELYIDTREVGQQKTC